MFCHDKFHISESVLKQLFKKIHNANVLVAGHISSGTIDRWSQMFWNFCSKTGCYLVNFFTYMRYNIMIIMVTIMNKYSELDAIAYLVCLTCIGESHVSHEIFIAFYLLYSTNQYKEGLKIVEKIYFVLQTYLKFSKLKHICHFSFHFVLL